MSQRFTMVVAVHLFLIQDEKILLARRFQTGYEDGNFSVPAGHVDADESCLAAMIREAKEEVNIEIDPQHLALAHVMHRNTDRESIDFFFTCRKWSGTPVIHEPDKCDLIEWFPLDALPSNTIEYVRKAIKSLENKEKYSELGFEPTFKHF